ncbi:MAG: fatty acid hydroxylase [Hirschia sp.]|nr:fatty acid hydroxylase [Hirschia sp.]MBF16980.1 fatty acid hydroxylase [Hirschia sp.]
MRLMTHELIIRLGGLLGAFFLFAILESLLPDRARVLTRQQRWPGAWLLMFVSAVGARLILPVGLAGVALWAQAHHVGLFHQVDLPIWLEIVLAMLLLDLAVWAQHVATHKIPLLWRFHRVHHADPEVDVTTAFRFHPVEIAVSVVWKAVVVAMFGIPVLAAFWFEVVLNACAQFNHSNMKLPAGLDRSLRWILVTPAMHRIHHSVDRSESDTNFGFCLSVWDRLFGLYTNAFSRGPLAPIGQDRWRCGKDQRVDRLLVQPFGRDQTDA